MLVLSRKINQKRPEWINIHINYADNPELVRLIAKLGGNARMLDTIVDVVRVEPMDYRKIANDEEVVLGFDAPRHIIFRRSEIDRV